MNRAVAPLDTMFRQAVSAIDAGDLKDPAFQPYQLARWREALPAARVVELAGAGHWPHEEDPERVTGELRGFLAG